MNMCGVAMAGRVCVVTGPAGGIGLEVARQLDVSARRQSTRSPATCLMGRGDVLASNAAIHYDTWQRAAGRRGTRSVLWAAGLPGDGPVGGFFRDGRPISW